MMQDKIQSVLALAAKQSKLDKEGVKSLLTDLSDLFRLVLTTVGGIKPRDVVRITTKFRDAGRRSAPWRPASSRVPGRPQDGADGNRINRWLLPKNHKFYADEKNATLVEIKYFLQTLSMANAPKVPSVKFASAFEWLLDHKVAPGMYLDPVQIIPIDFRMFVSDLRTVQSGHLIPLDRGGKHVPENTFLMLHRSNQIQGNMTTEELFRFMEETLKRRKSLNKKNY